MKEAGNFLQGKLLFCKGPQSKYFRLAGHKVPTTRVCLCIAKHLQVNECGGSVQTKLYLWTLEFKFHIRNFHILQNIIYFLQPFKKVKLIWLHRLYKKVSEPNLACKPYPGSKRSPSLPLPCPKWKIIPVLKLACQTKSLKWCCSYSFRVTLAQRSLASHLQTIVTK